jgi:hypothetical protein
LKPARCGGDGVGRGVANKQCNERGGRGNPRRAQEDPRIERVEDEREIFQRKCVFDAAVNAAPEKGDGKHKPARNDHQHCQPSERRRHQEI